MAEMERRVAATGVREEPKRDLVPTPADDPLLDRMVRRPTEADFEDVLTPEGQSGDIFGSDVSESTAVSDGALAGTG